jgi:hypothetical protein
MVALHNTALLTDNEQFDTTLKPFIEWRVEIQQRAG